MLKKYFSNIPKYKECKEELPYGMKTSLEDQRLILFIDNEPWGKDVHIHLLTFIDKILMPHVEKLGS